MDDLNSQFPALRRWVIFEDLTGFDKFQIAIELLLQSQEVLVLIAPIPRVEQGEHRGVVRLGYARNVDNV